MLQQQIIDIIYLPFVTGIVGYLTNKLAIKMLFRPYKPKWYSLGWQGIVPKTKPILANKISNIVSNQLLSHDDLLSVISKDDFYLYIKNEVKTNLDNINENNIENIFKYINIKDIISKNSDVIDEFGNKFIDSFLNKNITQFININSLPEKISNFTSPLITNTLSSEISKYINNIYNSNKPIKTLIPNVILDKKDKIAEYITNITLKLIKNSGDSEEAINVATEKIISFKDSLFGGSSSDILKMGLVNMFLSNDTIKNTVKREFPKIVNDISNNSNLYNTIKTNILNEINILLNKNINEVLTDNIVYEINTSINSKLSSGEVKDKIENSMKNTLSLLFSSLTFMSFKDVLKLLSIDISKSFKLSNVLLSFDNNELRSKIYFQISQYIRNNSEHLSTVITDNFVSSIKTNLPKILNQLNIGKTVEDKINSLPLKDLEDMLFSFMKIHFKWINILGFVIGFIIGTIQLIITVSIH